MAEESSSSLEATGEATTSAALAAEDTSAVVAAETTTVCAVSEPPPTAKTAEGAPTNASAGEKRKKEEGEGATVDTPSTATTEISAAATDNKPKKAKIAMPPSVSSSLTDVEKYTLECPPPSDNTNEEDAKKKITTPNLMLFGLHPLIREKPLQKMLEEHGKVLSITVRSAFASRYGHITFETVEEARKCYTAIHGAKLLHKAFLVQPSMAAAPKPSESSSATDAPSSTDDNKNETTATKPAETNASANSAGAAAATAIAAAAAAVTTSS